MKGLEIKEEPDELLRPFLSSEGASASDSLLEALIHEHARPIVRGIVRDKLRVSLSPRDGDHLNQDALEICGEVNAMLLAQLQSMKSLPREKTINNFRSYVAVVTYNACHEYLRRKYPQRHSLKNRLRYLLSHRDEFAVWEGDGGELLCGLAQWRGRAAEGSASERLQRLSQTGPVKGRVAPSQMPLQELVGYAFKEAGGPLGLDELTTAVALMQGIQEWQEAPAQVEEEEDGEDQLAALPDTAAGVDARFDHKVYLEKLWSEIKELPPKQRAALLLNLKDPQGNSMVEMLPVTGVASVRQIADALGIPAAEFAALWNDLPLDDNALAARLGVSRQQVINLRKSARDRLARRMRDY